MEKLTQKEIEAFALKAYGATLGALDKAKDVAEAVAVLHPAIIKLLAEGKPASATALAEVVDRPRKDIEKMLALLPGLELNANGAVTGFGLSFIPTVHRVYLHKHDRLLYAWCIPDALILPRLINERATITSPAQDTGKPVTIELTPGAVKEVQPKSAVVSWWVSAIDAKDLRGTSCVNQNLFSSEEAAAAWQKEHEGATLLSVSDTFRALDVIRDRQYP